MFRKAFFRACLVCLSVSPVFSSDFHKERYEKFAPMFFSKADHPLIIDAVYFNIKSPVLEWTILATYKEGFVRKELLSEKQDLPESEGPYCTLVTHGKHSFQPQNMSNMNDPSLPADRMYHSIFGYLEKGTLKACISNRSIIFNLNMIKVSNEDIENAIHDFFNQLTNGITLFTSANVILMDWTIHPPSAISDYFVKTKYENRIINPLSQHKIKIQGITQKRL